MSGTSDKMVVTIDEVRSHTKDDETLSYIISHVLHIHSKDVKKNAPPGVQLFLPFLDDISVIDGVVMFRKRIVIPFSLRSRILDNLHSAHQGVAGMIARAQSALFWPGFTKDIANKRQACRVCNVIAPSQAKLPPVCPRLPKVPFEMIYADYFDLSSKHYLVIGDRLSGWTEILKIDSGESSGSKGLCKALRTLFATFGIPAEISSDGGPEFTSKVTDSFLKRWGIDHRLSSVCFPQSNGRAELAVKATKRLLRGNIDSSGELDTDNLVRALLQLRNTPDHDCKLSPAEILFGRPLNDSLPVLDKSHCVFENNQIHDHWHQAWAAKEAALRSRLVHSCESLEEHSKELEPLQIGDSVFVQNQYSSSKNFKRWDKQGTVVEVGKNDQYVIRIKGTGRMTLRNRRFLRKFKERSLHIDNGAATLPSDSVDLTEPTSSLNKRVNTSDGGETEVTLTDEHSNVSDIPEVSVEIGSSNAPHIDIDDQGMFGEDSCDEEFFGFPSQAASKDTESQENNNIELNESDSFALPLRRSARRKYKTKQYNASSGTYE